MGKAKRAQSIITIVCVRLGCAGWRSTTALGALGCAGLCNPCMGLGHFWRGCTAGRSRCALGLCTAGVGVHLQRALLCHHVLRPRPLLCDPYPTPALCSPASFPLQMPSPAGLTQQAATHGRRVLAALSRSSCCPVCVPACQLHSYLAANNVTRVVPQARSTPFTAGGVSTGFQLTSPVAAGKFCCAVGVGPAL